VSPVEQIMCKHYAHKANNHNNITHLHILTLLCNKHTYQSSGWEASGSGIYSGPSSSHPSGFTALGSVILSGASSSLQTHHNYYNTSNYCVPYQSSGFTADGSGILGNIIRKALQDLCHWLFSFIPITGLFIFRIINLLGWVNRWSVVSSVMVNTWY